jgi:hypothetical protein
VIAGSSASIAGAVHIVPPMIVNTGYVAPFAAAVKAKAKRPVFVAGRINQPSLHRCRVVYAAFESSLRMEGKD